VTWEDELAREMGQAERQSSRRAEGIARALAARDAQIVDLWGTIDRVVARVNARVLPAGRRFHAEESADPPSKAVFYGGRRLLFEVEPLAYDTWRNEPAFYPGGLARVFVDPTARDLSSLFCAVSADGPRWLVMPASRPVTDELIGRLLRVLVN
jgi:hypothetical protein